MGNSYLIWLEWPERCFRASEGDMRLFRSLVPKGSHVVHARSEGAFLKALPGATHAVVWHFEKEWYARAPKLKVLATPAAGRELVAWRAAPESVKVHFGTFHGPIISETVLGFLLAWTRGFFWKGPLWPRKELSEHCGDLHGTTAVIAGFGRIGRAIAARLEPFGVEHRLLRDGLGLGDIRLGDGDMRPRRRRCLARDDDLVGCRGGIDGEELRLAGDDLVAEIDADLKKRPGDTRRYNRRLDGVKRALDGRCPFERRVRHGNRPHRQRHIGQCADRLYVTLSAANECEG